MGCIYVLKDPRDNAVRYVGMTTKPEERKLSHLNNEWQGNPEKKDWVYELTCLSLHPIFEVIEDDVHVTQLAERERFHVQRISAAGAELLNRPVGSIRRSDIASAEDFQRLANTLRAARALAWEGYLALKENLALNDAGVKAILKADQKLSDAITHFAFIAETKREQEWTLSSVKT